MELQKLVHRALSRGLKNGYDNLLTDKPEAVATDLGDYESSLEGRESRHLVPHVKTWQAANKHKAPKAPKAPPKVVPMTFAVFETNAPAKSMLDDAPRGEYHVYRRGGAIGLRQPNDHPQYGRFIKAQTFASLAQNFNAGELFEEEQRDPVKARVEIATRASDNANAATVRANAERTWQSHYDASKKHKTAAGLHSLVVQDDRSSDAIKSHHTDWASRHTQQANYHVMSADKLRRGPR